MTVRIASSGGNALARWAWTEGLERFGQLDVTVPLPWPVSDPRDGEVELLLAAIRDAVESRGKHFRQGDTFHFGWTTVRFEAGATTGDSAGRLVVSELAEPLLATPEAYRRGAERLAALMRMQTETLRRVGLRDLAASPHRSDLAVICAQVPPIGSEYPRPLVLERRSVSAPGESGWVIRCASAAHDHDDARELAPAQLLHVVAGFPGIVAYLALPAECAVLIEDQEAFVFRPDEEQGVPVPLPDLRWNP